MKGNDGGVTNLELWLTNRNTSHGLRSLDDDDASSSADAANAGRFDLLIVGDDGWRLKALQNEIDWHRAINAKKNVRCIS